MKFSKRKSPAADKLAGIMSNCSFFFEKRFGKLELALLYEEGHTLEIESSVFEPRQLAVMVRKYVELLRCFRNDGLEEFIRQLEEIISELEQV